MSRLLLWITTALLGVVALFMTSFLGPPVLPLLTVALIVMVRADRVVAVSGLLIGYGGFWLLLLAGQASSGGTLEDGPIPVAFGAVLVVVGLVALVPTSARTLREHQVVDH